MSKRIFKRNIATLFLVLMCIQYIPLEGQGVSYVKVFAMLLAPLIMAGLSLKLSRALILGGVYLLVVTISILYNSGTFRISTVLYKFSFVFMFIMYYNLIYREKAFTIDYFISVVKGLLYAYIIFLLVQQIAIIIGIRSLPIINLITFVDRGFGSNSLALEPSHAARIMTALMLVLLYSYKISGKTDVSIIKFFKEKKWLSFGFLWAMLSMGSGTAFVGLGILSLFFFRKQNTVALMLITILLYFAIPIINYEPLNRAIASFEAARTLDAQVVIETDYSAAARIVPLINTFNELDVSQKETWVGKGIDSGLSAEYISKEKTIGDISDYGLLSYLMALILVFACCIKYFWSIETLIFFILMGASVSNIAFGWGILLLFTTLRYFKLHYRVHN